MLRYILFGLPLLFAVPDLKVRWEDVKQQAIHIEVSGQNEILEDCLKGGLEVRYRYELQLCRRRTGWFHACKERKVIMQSMQLDPIAQTYSVVKDRLGDDQPQENQTVDTRAEAVGAVSMVDRISLDFLSQHQPDFATKGDTYVGVRAFGECRGEYSELMSKIGYFITFGMVKVSAFNTGWIDFNLTKE
ncbi:MAG: DUF4390 domain-containing protein [Oligoflexia bacterium]|nr:DUF4390 domain-containing protein [Oligoflexia bacterium]